MAVGASPLRLPGRGCRRVRREPRLLGQVSQPAHPHLRAGSALYAQFCAEAETRDVGVAGTGPAHLCGRPSPPVPSRALSFRRLYRPPCLTLRARQGLV